MDVRHRTTAGNRFRYLLRFLGMLGLIVGAFGLVFYFSSNSVSSWESLRGSLNFASIDNAMLVVGAAGTIIAAVWLIVEALMAVALVTGSRAAVGGNNYLQIGLAAALFLVVNGVAFRHYARWDCTRDRQFTLNPELVNELRTLSNESPTDVVVLQLHKSSINRGRDTDDLDDAAEQKVTEKVNDLVSQLRELGPRFKVTVLDRKNRSFRKTVNDLPPSLRSAIKAAPEDSILFSANGRVRRISFSDFYRLDKESSLIRDTFINAEGQPENNDQPTNLVLLPQGKDEFVRRLLSLEQRKPRIGLMTIHPELSTRESSDQLSSSGLRKSLETNGFEVVDILSKKWGQPGGPQPAALSYEEYELNRAENRLNQVKNTMSYLNGQVTGFEEVQKRAKTMALKDLDRMFGRQVRRKIETEKDREFLLSVIDENLGELKKTVEELKPVLAKSESDYAALQKNEKAGEGRRQTDVAAKLKAMLMECDLVIIPRLTSINLAKREVISASFYPMLKDQVEAVKAYIAAGKPVLLCLGPTQFGSPREDAEPDELEKLFTSFGIEFGKQAIITDEEARAASERTEGGLGSASGMPSLVVDFATVAGKKDNPIREAFRVAARSVDGQLDLTTSGPRSVTISDTAKKDLPFATTILQSIKEAWNESKPLWEDDYVPKYESTKLDDPKKGTPEEERRGPFPVAAAIEANVPADWTADAALAGGAAKTPKVRLAAFGHGGMFVGKELAPAQEQLLLHTLNWQLGRDDLLPKDAAPEARWQFPRVEMSEQQKKLWHMGTFLGLPMLCAFAGVVVLMTRKMR